MKMMILALLLFPVMAFATITGEEEFALNRLSGVAKKYALGTLLAKNLNMVVGKYSYAVQGGAVGSINLLRDLNDTSSTVIIPSGSIVKQAYIDVLTTPTTSLGGSLAVQIQSNSDIKGNTAAASFTGLMAGTPVGSAATMIKLTAARTLHMGIASGALTAGKFNVYVEYALGD